MLNLPRLIVFSDSTRAPTASLLTRFGALAEGAKSGSVLFIVRDYQLSVRARLGFAEELRALVRRTGQSFGIADRADLARALGADAFHLPESGIGVSDARGYLGPEVFVSCACHEPSRVPEIGADAVLLSPIFAARKGRPALGLSTLERARARRGPAPGPALYALGAVDADNAGACLDAGAEGVAVIGAALSPEPRRLLEALKISRY